MQKINMKYHGLDLVKRGVVSAAAVCCFVAWCAHAALAEAAKPDPSRPIGDKWALLIGISKFKDASLNLKFPAKDARDVYTYLTTEGHFAPDHVKILTDEEATRERIYDELGDKWLPRVAMPDDLVVIYISTHGSPSDLDVVGVNYLIASDTDKDRLYSTGIAMQDLCRTIKARVHSDRTLIILDACHSGATTPDGKGLFRPSNVDADSVAVGTGQLVICSSTPAQTSWEAKNSSNSVFTKRLLEGLQMKGPETKLGEAFDYLKKKVQEDVLRERGQMQTPELKSKWEGKELIISGNPSDPRPVPPELLAAARAAAPRLASAVATEGEQGMSRSGATTASTPAIPARKKESALSNTARLWQGVPAGGEINQEAARLAEKALRDHFVRMAYGTPEEAWADFTDKMHQTMPLRGYRISVRRQRYLPSVRSLPDSAFKVVRSSPTKVVLLFDESGVTGIPLLWSYGLVNEEGRWLIDSVRKIQKQEWMRTR